MAPNRVEPFSEDAEKAAIFCLAELERGKGGGIVAKQPLEQINFIAKLAYPLWLFQFQEISLVFDGLNSTPHTTSYPTLPDIQTFVEGVERSSASRETYAAFLSDNANYFKSSGRQESLLTEGLISGAVLLEGFALYLPEAKPFNAEASDVVALRPFTEEASILSEISELEDLKSKFMDEAKRLSKDMKLLNDITKGFAKAVRGEIKEVKDKFNAELEKHRSPVEEEVRKIHRKGSEDTATASRRFEKELLRLQKEKVKLQKMRDQLSTKIANCEAEIKTSSAHKNKAAERRWKDEKGKRKKERSEVESQIKKLEKEIKKNEDEKGQELFRIKSDIDAKVQEANRELVEIESSRDAKVQVLKHEMEKMEELTSSIARQIEDAIRQRETAIASFARLGLPEKREKPLLVYMPFYLIGFQSGSRKRYVHFPPSTVNSVKLLVKLKGALGVARVKQLFTPRSEALATFLNRFPSMLEDNAAFERETSEAAATASLLKVENAAKTIRNGLEELKKEGWLSEKEHEMLSRALA